MKIKAISLWEPWATLMRTGAKRIETRTWAAKYRGPLLICAARAQHAFLSTIVNEPDIRAGLAGSGLHFGKAVALVELVDCLPTCRIDPSRHGTHEAACGDFSGGRYGWITKPIDTDFLPFYIRGQQGLFDVDMATWISEGRMRIGGPA